MKYVNAFLIVMAILVMVGCMGEDGDDGKAFLQIYIGYGCYGYYDNNPGIPSLFYEGQYYECSPGAYSYGYEDATTYYWGTYVLTIEEGDDGEIFWQDGADGADSYFTLNCYSSRGGDETGNQNGQEQQKIENNNGQRVATDTTFDVVKSGMYKIEITTHSCPK